MAILDQYNAEFIELVRAVVTAINTPATLSAVLTAGNDATAVPIVGVGQVTGVGTLVIDGWNPAGQTPPSLTIAPDATGVLLVGGDGIIGVAGGNTTIAGGGGGGGGYGGGGQVVAQGSAADGTGGYSALTAGDAEATSGKAGGDIYLNLGAGDGAGRKGLVIASALPVADPAVTGAFYVDPVTHIVYWK